MAGRESLKMSAASAEAGAPAVGQKRSRPEETPTAPVPDVLMLPGASIMRIVKSKLPDGVMVGSETKKAFGKACSLFILYLTTIAADMAKENSRTTVSASDVLSALRDLEFDDFLPSVEASLAAFRESEKARNIEAAAKRAANSQKQGYASEQQAAAEDAEAKEAEAEEEAEEEEAEEEES